MSYISKRMKVRGRTVKQLEEDRSLTATGFSVEERRRPLVGVVNSYAEFSPSNHMNRVVGYVKKGVKAAGGTPLEFFLSNLCSAHQTSNFRLTSRDIVAAYIEAMTGIDYFDGLVLCPVCDDTVAGHLQAAARLNIPSILVTGGYSHHIGMGGFYRTHPEVYREEELQKRLAEWKRSEPKVTKGFLALYAKHVQSADKGAILIP